MAVARRAIRLRMYPNQAQREQIRVSCAGAAYVWNKALEWRESAWRMGFKLPGVYEMKRMLPALKRAQPWLRECESSALQQVFFNLSAAYKRAFDNARHNCIVSRKRNRKTGSVTNLYGFPRYKSRKRGYGRSYHITNNPVRVRFVDERHIKLPKLGMVRVRGYRRFQGRITGATVKELACGAYELVLHVECEDFRQMPAPFRDVTGVDVGSRKLAVASDGSVFENRKALVGHAKRLARVQRSLSRKQRGSANYEKCRKRKARLERRIADTRHDAQNKASFEIVRDSQAVVVETLNVVGMLSNHRVAKCMSDAGVSELLRQLRYKCAWYGRDLIEAGQWFPSSRTCSVCGERNDELRSEETWVCPVCGTRHDRDLNAARNLEAYGRSQIANGFVTVGRDTPEPATQRVANACGEPSGGGSETVAA